MQKECGKTTKSKKQSHAKAIPALGHARMDKSGRRSSKTVGGQTTKYIYDGQNLIAERGASVAEFLFGPGIDEPLAMSRSGSAYYYDVDGLGSVSIVNDTTGTVQDKYLYDGWGITRSSTTPIANPFVYTARETAETGLLFYRARYYNPSIERFVSEDPQQSKSGINLYFYTNNSPMAFRDPLGLIAWNCTFGGGGAGIPGGYKIGPQLYIFDCQSECACGKTVKALLSARQVGIGSSALPFSIKLSGRIQLEDGRPCPSGYALVGLFWSTSRKTGGASSQTQCTNVTLGEGKGVACGDIPFLNYGVGGFIGESFLDREKEEPCCGITVTGES